MNQKKHRRPIGVLNTTRFFEHCTLTRFYPCESLSDFIEHYWYLTWKIPVGEQYQQSVIPHPNTHLTFIQNKSHIQGVCKQKYTHTLTSEGNLIGVKFKPAGFYPFAHKVGLTMKELCNDVMPIDEVFDIDVKLIEQKILSLDSPLEKINVIDNVLFSANIRLLKNDKSIVLLNKIVSAIAHNAGLITVGNVADMFEIPERQLQRLFAKYIGINVKWVINRYRIHEVLTQIDNNVANGQQLNWADFALTLGYYDQAHFIHDFTQLIGQSPKEYQRSMLLK